MSRQIVIIGAGEAGGRAAIHLRELGYPGRLVLVGDERHFPYERPPLSKGGLTTALSPTAPREILNTDSLATHAIEFLSAVNAQSIHRGQKTVILSDGRSRSYDKLLIATGASSRRMTVESSADVFYLRSFADSLKLRERLRPGTALIVVGGGFIGLEIASSAVSLGCRVTVLEAGPAILMRGVPPVVAQQVADRHRAAGVTIMTSATIARIARDSTGSTVFLSDGSTLACDLIVAGIGAVPVTQLAEASGLTIENGVRVDEFLCTDDPDIYAAGDCCSFPHQLYGGRRIRLEAWRNAQDQAATAAANMLGRKAAYAAVPWFWSDQFDDTLQVAGLYDADCTTIERRLEAASIYFHVDADGRLVAASAFGPSSVIGREIRISEMLIAQRHQADAEALANPVFKLKDMVKRAA